MATDQFGEARRSIIKITLAFAPLPPQRAMGARRWARAGRMMAASLVLGASNLAQAQNAIVPSSSETIVERGANFTDFEIRGGQKSGSNLFHSFDAFSVSEGRTATFQNTVGGTIDNVISRVTGADPSRIAGAVSVDIDGASFFLINPNGITVTSDGVFDVPGSVNLSTADALHFDEGPSFFADPSSDNGFSMAAPQAFGFLDGPLGAITVARSFPGSDAARITAEAGSISLSAGAVTVDEATLTAGAGGLLLTTAAPGDRIPLSTEADALNGRALSGALTISRADLEAVGGDVLIAGGDVSIDEAAVTARAARAEDGAQGGGLTVAAGGDLFLGPRIGDGFPSRPAGSRATVLTSAAPEIGDRANADLLLTAGRDADDGAQVEIAGVTLINDNAGEVSLFAPTADAVLADVFLENADASPRRAALTTTRLDFEVAAFTLGDGSRIAFDLERARHAEDLEISGRAGRAITLARDSEINLTLLGGVSDDGVTSERLVSSECADNCLRQSAPDIGLEAPEIVADGALVVSGEDLKNRPFPAEDGARPAVALIGERVFVGGEIEVVSIDGVLLEASERLELRGGDIVVDVRQADGEAFGLRASSPSIIVSDAATFRSDIGQNFRSCPTGDGCGATSSDAVGHAITLSAEGDLVIDDAEFFSTTISTADAGAFRFESETGDVRLSNVQILRTNSVQDAALDNGGAPVSPVAEGGVGSLFIEAPSGDVALADVTYLVVAETPETLDDLNGYPLGDLVILGENVVLEDTLLSIGTRSLATRTAFEQFADVVATQEEALNTALGLLIEQGNFRSLSRERGVDIFFEGTSGPTGSVRVAADGTLRVVGSVVSTAGAPSPLSGSAPSGGVALDGSTVVIERSVATANIADAAGFDGPIADSGGVRVSGDQVRLRDSDVTATSSSAVADAAAVTITARDALNLDQARVAATSLLTETGDVTLSASSVDIAADSIVSTDAGDAAAGRIEILAEGGSVLVIRDSQVTTSSDQNTGGQIRIDAIQPSETLGVVVVQGGEIRATGEIPAANLDVQADALLVDVGTLILVDGTTSLPDTELTDGTEELESAFLDAGVVLRDQCADLRGGGASNLAYRSAVGLRALSPAGERAPGFDPLFYAADAHATSQRVAALPLSNCLTYD